MPADWIVEAYRGMAETEAFLAESRKRMDEIQRRGDSISEYQKRQDQERQDRQLAEARAMHASPAQAPTTATSSSAHAPVSNAEALMEKQLASLDLTKFFGRASDAKQAQALAASNKLLYQAAKKKAHAEGIITFR